ncbi:MAG: LysR family transcriptional regulator substrate-binding protein, partial [Burkholderiaceae bacterium]|nr:LysR family transcriptional regulator substrate-binding protein [Burkholderiaceae bacterium]
FELRQQSERQAGQLRIGATGPYYLLPLLSRFRQQNQHIQVDVQFGNSHTILEALFAYQVDLALTSHTICDARLLQYPLASSPLVLLVHRDDPIAGLGTVSCAALQDVTLLTREDGSATQLAASALITVSLASSSGK